MSFCIGSVRSLACVMLSLAAISFSGCGKNEVQQTLDYANQTVRQSLEHWKSGSSFLDLQKAELPIDFHDDDWQAGARLIDFEIRKTYLEPSDKTARCAVTLKIQRKKGPPLDVKCTYQIVSEPETIVARDPMS